MIPDPDVPALRKVCEYIERFCRSAGIPCQIGVPRAVHIRCFVLFSSRRSIGCDCRFGQALGFDVGAARVQPALAVSHDWEWLDIASDCRSFKRLFIEWLVPQETDLRALRAAFCISKGKRSALIQRQGITPEMAACAASPSAFKAVVIPGRRRKVDVS